MTSISTDARNLRALVGDAVVLLGQNPENATSYIGSVVAPILTGYLSNVAALLDAAHKVKNEAGQRHVQVVHYTSIETIFRILRDAASNARNGKNNDERPREPEPPGGYLRLYDTAHFNDPDEGNHIIHALNADRQYDWLTEHGGAYAYIASFMPVGAKENIADDLVLWRTYGDEGEGCSIKVSIPAAHLREVNYSAENTRRAAGKVNRILSIVQPLLDFGDDAAREEVRRVFAESFREGLGKVQFLHKAPAFRHENEYRVVMTRKDFTEDDISFHYRRSYGPSGHLRHYYEHPALGVGEMIVSGSEVTVGPRVLAKEDVRNSLEILVRRAKLEQRLKVKVSRQPFYRVI